LNEAEAERLADRVDGHAVDETEQKHACHQRGEGRQSQPVRRPGEHADKRDKACDGNQHGRASNVTTRRLSNC